MIARVAVFLFAFMFLATAPSSEPISTNIPSALADKPDEFWPLFMTEMFGEKDAATGTWVVQPDSLRKYLMTPNSFDLRVENGERRLFITVAGEAVLDHQAEQLDTGAINFYVLEQRAEKMEISSYSAYPGLVTGFGSFGKPPPPDAIKLIQINARGEWGWQLDITTVKQEATASQRYYVGVIFENILSFDFVPLSFKNNTDSDFKYNITLDYSDPQAQFATIQLQGSGTRNDFPFSDFHTVYFNAIDNFYTRPGDLHLTDED